MLPISSVCCSKIIFNLNLFLTVVSSKYSEINLSKSMLIYLKKSENFNFYIFICNVHYAQSHLNPT